MSDDTEIPLDIKNDIQLAFNIYKNENNKINKLKLRTILFSFVMYKFSASDINDFIETRTLKEKELYTFDDVCDLVKEKLLESKERDADELFNYIMNRNDNKNDKGKNANKNKTQNQKDKKDNKNENGTSKKSTKITKACLTNAFKSACIDINIDEKDIDKMLEYMKNKQLDESEKEEAKQENKESERPEDGKQDNNENKDNKEKDQQKEVVKITRSQFKQFYVEPK